MLPATMVPTVQASPATATTIADAPVGHSKLRLTGHDMIFSSSPLVEFPRHSRQWKPSTSGHLPDGSLSSSSSSPPPSPRPFPLTPSPVQRCPPGQVPLAKRLASPHSPFIQQQQAVDHIHKFDKSSMYYDLNDDASLFTRPSHISDTLHNGDLLPITTEPGSGFSVQSISSRNVSHCLTSKPPVCTSVTSPPTSSLLARSQSSALCSHSTEPNLSPRFASKPSADNSLPEVPSGSSPEALVELGNLGCVFAFLDSQKQRLSAKSTSCPAPSSPVRSNSRRHRTSGKRPGREPTTKTTNSEPSAPQDVLAPQSGSSQQTPTSVSKDRRQTDRRTSKKKTVRCPTQQVAVSKKNRRRKSLSVSFAPTEILPHEHQSDNTPQSSPEDEYKLKLLHSLHTTQARLFDQYNGFARSLQILSSPLNVLPIAPTSWEAGLCDPTLPHANISLTGLRPTIPRTRHSIATVTFAAHSAQFMQPISATASKSLSLPPWTSPQLATMLPLSAEQKLQSLQTKLPLLFPTPLISPHFRDELCRPTFIFVDHSNVIWSFLRFINDHYPCLDLTQFDRAPHGAQKVRMDYRVLFAILERDPNQRDVLRKYIAASNPLYQPEMIEYWNEMGYETAILNPVVNRNPSTRRIHRPRLQSVSLQSPLSTMPDSKTGTESDSDGSRPSPTKCGYRLDGPRYKEQAVDEVIQLNMLDAVMDFNWIEGSDPRPRPILTLVSGDANAGEYSKSGFAGWVSRCLMMGWDVEIVGFKKSISNRYWQEAKRTSGPRKLPHTDRLGTGKLVVHTLDHLAAELVADEA